MTALDAIQQSSVGYAVILQPVSVMPRGRCATFFYPIATFAPGYYHAFMSTAAVITVSDSRSAGRAEDASGPAAAAMLEAIGLRVVERRIVPDDAEKIAGAAREFINRVAVLVTTGGTGIGPRDVTPEAIRPLFDRELPGFGEIMRTGSFAKTPLSIISRGGAGVAGTTLVIMLPGSPKAVRECLELVTPAIKHLLHVLSQESVDCAMET